jgi:hypothetical protein
MPSNSNDIRRADNSIFREVILRCYTLALEDNFQAELNLARRESGNRFSKLRTAQIADRIEEVYAIEKIESLGAELDIQILPNSCVLE